MFPNVAKCNAFSKKVGYIKYFGIDRQSLGLGGDQDWLKLKQHVHISFEDQQHSIANQPNNPTIHELSPWLRVSYWHNLATNHIIPLGAPMDEIMATFELLGPIDGDFKWGWLPLMIQAYHEKSQTIICHVQYWLKQLVIVIVIDVTKLTKMGFNELWVLSTRRKYCTLMTKLFIAMI